ncbi:glycosyltransferase family 2 protein [Intestinibaculum porci]|uniref:Glycosyl transferase n=1 Tax=Intestinibaculum porci TaxID=2487118 RepID=A0A3G9JS80_9FIRM|nr:glycosyltransferase family 2 protein [Intestinibaculum porci]MDD6348949.1 glycosyltransferase family 2 protein [Intestinibaculum porci]BBH27258.1 glycosyl transferase [Intestinibaculum porci]
METENKVGIVLVTYNRLKLLLQAIDALLNQTYRNADILIINNASTDDTEEQLKPYVERGDIIYFNTGKNLGGAGGFNYGLKTAYEKGYKYFWMMDDDSIAEPDALEKLVKASEFMKGKYSYLSNYVYWRDGSPCKMNAPQIADDWMQDANLSYDGLIRIQRATFVGFFTNREIVEKVGLPIKEFFIWSDDTNYCWRCNKIAPGYLVSDAKVEHRIVTNADADIVTDDTDRLSRYVYAFRNRAYNYRMVGIQSKYKIYVLRKFLQILKHSKNGKWKRIRVMMKGVRQGKHFNPPIEYVNKR